MVTSLDRMVPKTLKPFGKKSTPCDDVSESNVPSKVYTLPPPSSCSSLNLLSTMVSGPAISAIYNSPGAGYDQISIVVILQSLTTKVRMGPGRNPLFFSLLVHLPFFTEQESVGVGDGVAEGVDAEVGKGVCVRVGVGVNVFVGVGVIVGPKSCPGPHEVAISERAVSTIRNRRFVFTRNLFFLNQTLRTFAPRILPCFISNNA